MIFIIKFILYSHNNYHVMRLSSIKNFWGVAKKSLHSFFHKLGQLQQIGLPFAVVSQVYAF
jgi:hypothetical protein